jgi:cyclophilin family peptidyl-prolyl cis-trans isomerase
MELAPMKRFFALATLAVSLAGTAFAQEVDTAPIVPPTEPNGPVVTLQTTMGDIEITLDPVGAPKTAAHFQALVEKKYYDGAAVYRVEPGFVVQLGDLDRDLKYRHPPLPDIPLETANNRHSRGAVAMARAEETNSGNATFYFDLSENTGLGATPGAPPNTTGYAVFGRVTSGMDIVDAMGAVELAPEGGPFPGRLPKQPIVVTKAIVSKP